MGIHMIGSEAIEQINKIESTKTINQKQKQNQNQNHYIDISYSETPYFNELNDTNDTNDTNDMDYPFDSN